MNADLAAVKAQIEAGMRVYTAFKKADEAIAALANLDQVADELTARKGALATEVETMEAARAEAEAARDAAQAAAQETVNAAAARAASMLQEARDDVSKMAAAARARADASEQAVADNMRVVTDLEADRDALAAELQTLNDKIAAAKEAAAKLLA